MVPAGFQLVSNGISLNFEPLNRVPAGLQLGKAGRYSIGIVLPTQNWTILGFPNIGFTSQYNTNTIKKVVDKEEEEEENQRERAHA